MTPEQAARAREQYAAVVAASLARDAVQRARIGARMVVEGRVPMRAIEFRAGSDAVFWAPASKEVAGRWRPGYRRMTVTRVSSPPRWSRKCSISGAAGDYALALPDATIYVRTQ